MPSSLVTGVGTAVTMLESELLQNGIGRITEILTEMNDLLEEKEYHSLDELQGSLSQINCGAPAAFERANYIQVMGHTNRIIAKK